MGAKARAAKAKQAEEVMNGSGQRAPPVRTEEDAIPDVPLLINPRNFWLFFLGVALAGHYNYGAQAILPEAVDVVYRFLMATPFFTLAYVSYEGAASSLRHVGQPADFTLAPKTRELVTNGIYRFGRNPMFMSMILVNVAIAISLNCAYYCNALLPVLTYLQYVVHKEERVMEKAWGERYRQYKSTVPQWLTLLPSRS